MQHKGSWAQMLKDSFSSAHHFSENGLGHLSGRRWKKIAFIGMGGSGIAGRILKTILDKKTALTSFVFDSPTIPLCVDADTLVFISSYSGNTWEVCQAFDQLIERRIPMIVFTHGGMLQKKAHAHAIPTVVIPEAWAPRAALGYFLGSFLALCTTLDLFDGESFIASWYTYLEMYEEKLIQREWYDPFLKQALMYDFFHVWGVAHDSASCMYRAQTQFNENSKVPAVYSEIPELCHNLLVGFTPRTKNRLIVIGFTHFVPEPLATQINNLCQILEEEGVTLYKVPILGDTWESQLLHLIVWADNASWYLGQLRNENIQETLLITKLKELLKKKVDKR